MATTHLKSSRKSQLALSLLFLKTSDGGNKEQTLAEVVVRRAEEIKHLTEASEFLFQQIKSILLKAEGRKEKHARTMPEKNLFAFNGLENYSRVLRSCKKATEMVSGFVRLRKTLCRELVPSGNSHPLHLCPSPHFQEESRL